MRIGLVGAQEDPIIQHLAGLIVQRGAEPVLLDSNQFPQETTLSITPFGTESNGVCLDDVTVWHVRAVYQGLPVFMMEDREYALFQDWRARYLADREQYSMMVSWLRILALRGNFVLNPVESFDLHFLKPFHIESLRRAGFPVPQTLVSNDQEKVKSFVGAFPSVIYKPVAGGAYCREIRPEDLSSERLELLRNAPVIFQERIEGENIRVYVVGGRVVSASLIHTDALDYRGNEDHFEAITLPTWVEEMCLKAAQLSHMPYSGIDLIRGPRGYTFLECNPTPVHLGVEVLLGHPISEAIVDLLMQEGRSMGVTRRGSSEPRG